MRNINNILPTELFFQIFHHLVFADGPLGLRKALFVCRLWNSIIFNDSHLWTNIVFNQTFVQQLVPYPGKLLNYIERCGASSGDHFIRIQVDTRAIHDHIYPGGVRAQQSDQQRVSSTGFSLFTIARAMVQARSFSEKIRTLVLSGGHRPSAAIRITIFMIINLVEDRLQHLELRMYTDDAIESIVRIFNSVETVFLLEPNWEGPGYVSSKQIAARRLVFQRTSPWRGEDLTHLGLYQKLRELRLIWCPTGVAEPSSFKVEPFYHMNVAHTRHSVLLPSVTTLYMRGVIPFRILDPLSLPALTMMEVQNHEFRQPLSTVRSTTLHYPITKLVVRFTPETAEGWGGALAAVLAAASQLHTLIAPRWMERHLSVPENVKLELV